eukprot:CAMPEP_0113819268 /NCGR_PEP_ID=MMETSP0328-20130328/655_1 /TAXON_ID=39455 /ORGANISM="Alexandrium minutum" /LENGTH=176 /DNA_ID=CAMNT_0000787203 /DNA_START=74 /DNA_END=601 /DNA_ORIENTATION=- /assembly_acc=CAM_ASM_000350
MATVQILVTAAFSGEQLAAVEVPADSTVDELCTAVSIASPTSSPFFDLLFRGAALSDGAADIESVGLCDGAVVQLVAGQQLTATLKGFATREESDAAGWDDLEYTASVEPFGVDEFCEKAKGTTVQQFSAANVLTIMEENYMSQGRLCGTNDLAAEEAILSFIKGAGAASGFFHEW